MKRKKGLLETVRRITALFFFLLTALIFLSEISHHRKYMGKEIDQAVESYYRERRDHLRDEIDRIVKRVNFQKEEIRRQTENEVKSRALEGYALARALYDRDRENSGGEIVNVLRGLTYNNGEGYYFILDGEGTVLMNRGTPERENRTVESQDSRGRLVVSDILALARDEGEGFLTYEWYRPSDPGKWLRKKVYIKTFEPYGWIIGTGLYEDEISRNLQKNLLSSIEYVFAGAPDSIFIGDSKGNMLLGADKGTNFLQSGDEEKEARYRDFFTAAEKGDFLEYTASGPDESKRLCYLKKVDDWNWFIGAGIYTDELERNISVIETESAKAIMAEMTRLSLIVLIFFMVILLFFKVIEKYFSQDLEYFTLFFKQASTDNIPQEKEKIRFRELYDLGDYADTMVKDKRRIEREKQKNRNLESLSFLAAGIAHDFNNALMGIFGNIELAQLCIETGENPLPFLDNALKAMEQTRKITARLLPFTERGHPDYQSLSLNEIIDRTEDQWMEKSNRPVVNKEIPENTLIRGDADQLVLALTLILTNSYESMEEKGEITIRAEKTVLSQAFSSRLSGSYVRVDIIDRGRGMDEETLEKVFDPYFSTKQTGRGLGLPTLFSIMKHHRGYADISSAKGEGTTVTLYLPNGEDQTS